MLCHTFFSLTNNTKMFFEPKSMTSCNICLLKITSFSPWGQGAMMESRAVVPRQLAMLGEIVLGKVDLGNWALFTFSWVFVVINSRWTFQQLSAFPVVSPQSHARSLSDGHILVISFHKRLFLSTDHIGSPDLLSFYSRSNHLSTSSVSVLW